MPDEVGVMVSRTDGTVVAQSSTASAWIGRAEGRVCWALMARVPGARGLPCNEHCVRERFDTGTPIEPRTVALRGQRYALECVPAERHIVTVLRSLNSPVAEPWERLTPREVVVLRLMADGLNTGAIADELGIQPGTVRAHVEHMRVRLGCKTRAAVVARGFRLEYLS